MRSWIAALLAGVGLLALAGTASAVPVAISYSLTGTMIGAVPGNIGWNTNRPFTGNMTVVYQGTGANTLYGPPGGFAGAARIDSFYMDAAAAASLFGSVFFGGQIQLTGGAQASGLLGTGLALPINVLGSGSLPCSGGTYTCFGYSPRNVSIGIAGSLVPYLLGSPTAAAHSMKVNLGGGLALINPLNGFGGFALNGILTATEISRTFVPEPDTGRLLALGLLVVAAAGWTGERRLRRRPIRVTGVPRS